jgi:hypothetical protein
LQDIWILAAASMAFAALVGVVFGNPQTSAVRIKTSHSLGDDPAVRFVPERSPYMRTER